MSSWCSSARRAAGSPRSCGSSPGSKRSRRARSTIGEQQVTDLDPKDRDVAMVFQNYALYPHMTVEQNLGVRAEAAQDAEGRASAAGRRRGEDPGPRTADAAQARRALGRPAAARGDGPGDGARAAGVPDGRAALEPRREAPRADARAARRGCTSGCDDHGLRHPRPGRGDDARPTRRRPEGRRAPAGRHAAEALQPSRQPVRRRVHRLAADEPRGGDVPRRRARSADSSSRCRPGAGSPTRRRDGDPGHPPLRPRGLRRLARTAAAHDRGAWPRSPRSSAPRSTSSSASTRRPSARRTPGRHDRGAGTTRACCWRAGRAGRASARGSTPARLQARDSIRLSVDPPGSTTSIPETGLAVDPALVRQRPPEATSVDVPSADRGSQHSPPCRRPARSRSAPAASSSARSTIVSSPR